MVQYKVSIKTGDLDGGTDADIYISLYGNSAQTETFLLDNPRKDDSNDSFYMVDSPVNILQVQRIEFWRETNDDWYCNEIRVENLGSKVSSWFLVDYKVKQNEHVYSDNIDTYLPQDEPLKEKRARQLKKLQEKYQLEVKVPGLPAMVKQMPEDEKFPFGHEYNIEEQLKGFNQAGKQEMDEKGLQWKSMEDVLKNVYVKPFSVPRGASNFNDDARFGQQRLAHVNANLITLCKEIPEKFGVSNADITAFLEGKSVDQVIDENRLFIVDFEILEGIPTKSPELLIPSPIALFYFNNENKLMPIAIQLYQQKGKDNPVFFPTDPPNTWLLAKMWFNMSDAHYHQSITHLNITHFVLEGFYVALRRQLAPSHPLFKLLCPHFLYILPINYRGLLYLANPGGHTDRTSNGGINGMFWLIDKCMKFWRLDVHGTLPENMKERQVLDSSILKDAYHFRDDAMLFYNAIKDYVTNYVNIYYASEGSVLADLELQAWGAEIVKSRDTGGLGILGVPNNGKFETREHLIQTIAPIIYLCSAGHAAANFQKYDEYAAPFNFPYMLYGVPPKDKSPVTEEMLLKTIGNRKDVYAVMTVTATLSTKTTQSLGYFEKQLIFDPPAVKILQEFRAQLKAIEKIIDERNTNRTDPYDYLKPSRVPNSVSI